MLFYLKKKVGDKLNIFGKDVIIGDFKLSDYGLMVGSFDFPYEDDEDLGMSHETIEEFIGHYPTPISFGASYSSKLKPVMTIVKDKDMSDSMYFNSHECREVLRQLTGFSGYKTMQIFPYNFDELLYFNVRVVNVSYKKLDNSVVGIILEMECDSQFAWSEEFNYTYQVSPTNPLIVFNTSDDLYNYIYPLVKIKSVNDSDVMSITNIEDNNWTTEITSLNKNEVITMDSKREIISSSVPDRLISNNFNMHFIRLKSGKNEFTFNNDAEITLSFRVPRKVGFVL